MAKEPNTGKKPGGEIPDENDNLLSDTSMDDLDLESLLADDEDVAAKPEKPAPTPAAAPEDDVIVVDDGEIDLLAEDEPESEPAPPAPAEEPEELSVDDLLGDDLGEETKALTETATNGDTTSEPAAEALDDLQDMDLLADDEPTASHGHEEKEAAGAAAGAAAAAAGAAAAAEGAGEAPATKKGKKDKSKLGKAREPAGARAGKKDKPKKESAPRKAAESAPVAAAASGAARGSVTFICSECYEELLLSTSYSSETLSCPECLHVGKRPDQDFLRTVHRHKAGERSSLLVALVAAVVLLCVLGAAVWMTSDNYLASNKKPDEMVLYGLAGGSVLLTGVLLWLVTRYEKNRWEVYF